MGNFKQLTRNINKTFRNHTNPKSLNHIRFRTVRGFKAENDKVLQLNTGEQWINITFPDLMLIINHMFENENRIYPKTKGYKGKTFLFNAIKELYVSENLEDVLRKFGDNKTVKP